MSAHQPQTDHRLNWLTSPVWPGHHPQAPLKTWLTAEGWLTARLKRLSPGGFRVEVLPDKPQAESDSARSTLRRVIIWCDHEACIYAETDIPHATAAAHPWLRELGAEPLGQALESRADVSRGAFEYALVNPASLPKKLSTTITEHCWARRSVFSIGREKITVTEVFLPGINNLDPKPLHLSE